MSANEPFFSFGYLKESYYTSEMSNILTVIILHTAFLIHTLMLTMINLQKKTVAGQAENVISAVDDISSRFKEQLKYAHEISSGNLDYQPKKRDDDEMLRALHDMNDNLKKNAKDEKIRTPLSSMYVSNLFSATGRTYSTVVSIHNQSRS